MIGRLLCKLGFHKWMPDPKADLGNGLVMMTQGERYTETCSRCGGKQSFTFRRPEY